ncbi:MAG: ATP-binding protein [Planctomycetota bacterium]|jgi:signal transduction histidine kinase
MKIRSKLILAVALLIVVHLTSATLAIRAVNRNARNTDLYTRMRELGQLAADLRTDIYHQLASGAGAPSPLREPIGIGWPHYALDDIEVQIRLADHEFDKHHWTGLRDSIVAMHETGMLAASENGTLREAEHHIRSLRNKFSLRESEAIATIAMASYGARVAMTIAGVLTVALFLLYLLIVWKWLVRPIEQLQRSTDILGTGSLDHRVDLHGKNELAELGRRLDAMAGSLARQQRELLEARELSAIGELCTNVAHGLRNPLASLRASAQLAGRRAGDAEETKLSLLEIIRQVDRVDKRITQLFEFSRPCHIKRRPATFVDVAHTAIDEVCQLAASKNVKLAMIDETNGRSWAFDDTQIAEAVSELATNAIHHCEEDDHVSIIGSFREPDSSLNGCLIVAVSDSGRGMPPHVAQRAFDLFFTSRNGGSGMGLAMVRRAVERHGGEIQIDSEEGMGTTVTLVIPGGRISVAAPAPLTGGRPSNERV